MRNQLEKAFGQVSELRDKLSRLENEQQEPTERNRLRDRCVDLLDNLRKTSEDFAALSLAMCQLLENEEPDVSCLLGIDPGSSPSEETRQLEHISEAAICDELELEFHRLQSTIDGLRSKVSDKYADSIGNRSGCISQ